MRIWAVVPCRSGSKGLPNKNIRPLAGVPLIGHAIAFAQDCGAFERILVSTDSEDYARIGAGLGGWVPFLRSAWAAQDTSMEEDILEDLAARLPEHGITPPDVLVWLRPVFPFRRVEDVVEGLKFLTDDVQSVRLVTDGEPRLYRLDRGFLKPNFDDKGRSMLRRQEFPECARVYHTDIFWYRNVQLGSKFLGDAVSVLKIHKLCSVDVDSMEDFEVADAIITSGSAFVRGYSAIARRL